MIHSTRHRTKKFIGLSVVIGATLAAVCACGTDAGVSALAATHVTKIAVDYTCEETSEATQWLEVGLRLHDSAGTVEAIVVEHDDDASPNNRIPSPVLIKWEKTKFILDRSDKKNPRSIFTGSTIKLAFGQSMSGEISIIADGPHSRNQSKIDCFKNADGTSRLIRFVSKK